MFYYEIYCLLFQLMFRLLGISSDLVLAYFQGFQRIYSELSQILKKKNWGFFYDHIPNFCKCSMCLFSQNCKNLVNFVNFLMLVNHQLFYTLIHFISAYFVSKWKWCVEVFHHFCRFIYSFFGSLSSMHVFRSSANRYIQIRLMIYSNSLFPSSNKETFLLIASSSSCLWIYFYLYWYRSYSSITAGIMSDFAQHHIPSHYYSTW